MDLRYIPLNDIKVGSLFSGIGGIDLGFNQSGFKTVWANEMDKHACITYRLNHKNKIFEMDVRGLKTSDLEGIDVLTAGFPCQAFSIAGNKLGFEDERGGVFFEILRFVEDMKPRVVFLENVKNIKSHNNGQTLDTITGELWKRGYRVRYSVLNSSEYGNVPQNRERIYIVAFRDVYDLQHFQFPTKKPLNKTVRFLLSESVDDKYYYNQSKIYHKIKEHITSRDYVYRYRSSIRQNKKQLCPTLTARMGTGGHNVPLILDHKDIRKLTPRECARLQGYDDDFILSSELSDSHLYKQIGNSVTVSVIASIAKEIRRIFNFSKEMHT